VRAHEPELPTRQAYGRRVDIKTVQDSTHGAVAKSHLSHRGIEGNKRFAIG
jgi:hypothetical protein